MAVTGILDQSNLTAGSTAGIGATTPTRYFAQQITIVEAGFLSDVIVKLSKQGSPVDNTEIIIYNDSSNEPNVAISDTQSFVSSTIGSTDFLEVTFITQPAIAASDKVWLVLTRSGANSPSNRVLTYVGLSNPYAGGKCMTSADGITWADYGTSDLYFQEYFTTGGGGGSSQNSINQFYSYLRN